MIARRSPAASCSGTRPDGLDGAATPGASPRARPAASATTSRKRTFLATESTRVRRRAGSATASGQTGIARRRCPGPAIAGASGTSTPEDGHGAQGVEHVQTGHRLGRPDGGEVDVLVPGQEQACLRVDGPAGQPRVSDRSSATSPASRIAAKTRHPARAVTQRRWAARAARGTHLHRWRIRLGGLGHSSAEGTRRERRTGAARGRRHGGPWESPLPTLDHTHHDGSVLCHPARCVTPVSRRPERTAVPILGRVPGHRGPVGAG